MSDYRPDTAATTWVEPCTCVAGAHLTMQRDDFAGFVAHLGTIYRFDRKRAQP